MFFKLRKIPLMTYKEKLIYYIVLVLCLIGAAFACGGWEDVNIKEGNHIRVSATPQVHNWRAFEVVFIDDSKYFLKNLNQFDWNKLRGFYSIQICNPPAHADMGCIAWRYIPEIDSFQVTPYTHSSCGERKWENAINVGIGQTVTCQIEADDDFIYFIEVGDSTYYYVHDRTRKANVFKQLNGYFGGDEVAPNDITYFVKDLKDKVW